MMVTKSIQTTRRSVHFDKRKPQTLELDMNAPVVAANVHKNLNIGQLGKDGIEIGELGFEHYRDGKRNSNDFDFG